MTVKCNKTYDSIVTSSRREVTIMKKLVLIALGLILLTPNLILTKNVQAATIVSIQPMFSNIAAFSNSLVISTAGMATVASYLSASNITSCKVDVSLQQLKNGTWTVIKTWTNTSSGTSAGLSGTYYVTKGSYYRTVSVGSVYKSGVLIENTTYTSAIKYY